MARSIVLRFDAQCFDCGASLPAGSTARWFGRGRVSCCGTSSGAAPSSAPAAPAPRALPPRGVPVPLSSMLPPSASDRVRSFVDDTTRELDKARASSPPAPAAAQPQHAPIPPYLPSPELAQLAADTGVPLEALASGLSPAHVAILATKTPNQRLLVRLSSGARFIAPAVHCAHVIRCVEESLVDRCRDVMLLADGGRS